MEFWRGLEQWTVPIGLFASQVLKLGGQPISLQFGPRGYVDGPSGGPEWGLRFNTVRSFPQSGHSQDRVIMPSNGRW